MSEKRQSKSRLWHRHQEKDPQVRAARAAGYRSRAAYKLLEMNAAVKFLRRGARVVDLGAAPGGWSQVAAAAVGADDSNGAVVAVDILPMAAISGVFFLQGDFCDAAVADAVRQKIPNGADAVLSDMSPNLSGIDARDQAQAAALALAALEFAAAVLAPGGCFIVKTFQGISFDSTRRRIADTLQGESSKNIKESVRIFRLESTRSNSRETYLCAKRA